MKFKNDKSTLILATLNFILIFAWATLFLQVSKIKIEYEALSKPLAEESGKESYITKISRQFRETEKARALLAKLLVDKGDEAGFLEKIESLGVLSGTTLKISAFEERGGVLRLGVKSVGNFEQVHYFINLLEAHPLSIKIEKALLSESSGESSPKKWEAMLDINLKNYYSDDK